MLIRLWADLLAHGKLRPAACKKAQRHHIDFLALAGSRRAVKESSLLQTSTTPKSRVLAAERGTSGTSSNGDVATDNSLIRMPAGRDPMFANMPFLKLLPPTKQLILAWFKQTLLPQAVRCCDLLCLSTQRGMGFTLVIQPLSVSMSITAASKHHGVGSERNPEAVGLVG